MHFKCTNNGNRVNANKGIINVDTFNIGYALAHTKYANSKCRMLKKQVQAKEQAMAGGGAMRSDVG